MNVLMTFGKHPKTLAVARSLGRSGRKVFISDDAPFALSSFSKYCSASFRTASPLNSPSLFLRQIESICKDHSIDLIIPMDDAECDILSLSDFSCRVDASIALPPPTSYWIARDKHKTLQLASSLGMSVPKTFLVTDEESVSSIPGILGLPAIVKPRIGSGSRGFLILDEESKLPLIRSLFRTYGELLAQEFIPSKKAIGASFLYERGRTRAVFVHKRIVQFPHSGGPSILRESIHDPLIAESAMALLDKLEWHGVAMVEFRIDSRTDTPILMEINPRFWGSLPLAIASGVDFPSLLCDVYEKGGCAFVDSYEVGLRCANLLPFGLAALMSNFGRRGTAHTAHSLLASGHFDVESAEDPMPILGALLSMARNFANPGMVEAVLHRSA